jgi:adenosylmethionine-8-amino-7-oxononanoate aminotransferase
MLFEVVFIDTPNPENLESLQSQIKDLADETACFIYEPLIQGAAGMLMYDAADLNHLMQICRKHEILMIQDEVFTGFGRTGKLFAANHLTEQPDIMCFSKGLTGGTMPMGITTCSNDIYDAFLSEDHHKTLFHGHSFTANPLACAAALASMELLLQNETQMNIKRITHQHSEFIKVLAQHPQVEKARHIGTIMAFDFKTGQGTSYFNEIGKNYTMSFYREESSCALWEMYCIWCRLFVFQKRNLILSIRISWKYWISSGIKMVRCFSDKKTLQVSKTCKV